MSQTTKVELRMQRVENDPVIGTFVFCYDPADTHAEPPNPRMPASVWSHIDEHLIRARHWKIRPGDVVLDVGAAFGSYALPAAALGAAKVIAWSPDWNGDVLEASIAANPGWDRIIERRKVALWSRPGWLVIPRDASAPAFYDRGCAVPDGAVPATTLDADVADDGLERVDWMKLDVEGAEVEVLRGAAATIARFRPRILVEHHQFKDETLEAQVLGLLVTMGYRLEEVVKQHEGCCVSHGLYLPVGGGA